MNHPVRGVIRTRLREIQFPSRPRISHLLAVARPLCAYPFEVGMSKELPV